MSVKVSRYIPTSSINENTTPVKAAETNVSEESFQDVLVLNQNALRAMAIDAMVAESKSGSVAPDAVTAASVMNFRNSLGSNIVAPVPTEDFTLSAPQQNFSRSMINSRSSISSSNMFTQKLGEHVLATTEELNAYFHEAATTYGIDEKLLRSIARTESNFNPLATSHAGAMGIMQMMPATAAECGVTDPYDARQSIMGGAQYFTKLLNKYNGNTALALAAYNAGPGNVDNYGGIPPFEETQNYVQKVLTYYNS